MRALENRFSDLTQVAFWAGQEEEIVFPVPGNHLKHPFIDFTKVAFWAGSESRE